MDHFHTRWCLKNKCLQNTLTAGVGRSIIRRAYVYFRAQIPWKQSIPKEFDNAKPDYMNLLPSHKLPILPPNRRLSVENLYFSFYQNVVKLPAWALLTFKFSGVARLIVGGWEWIHSYSHKYEYGNRSYQSCYTTVLVKLYEWNVKHTCPNLLIYNYLFHTRHFIHFYFGVKYHCSNWIGNCIFMTYIILSIFEVSLPMIYQLTTF